MMSIDGFEKRIGIIRAANLGVNLLRSWFEGYVYQVRFRQLRLMA
jgi:hypothetical protein